MLRYLTHKLKTQSLNEADNSCPSKNDDDHDSGTESDDEGADAEELEKYMEESSGACSVGGGASSDRASSTLDTLTDATERDCPSDLEQHSSEEELEVINCAAKRKWSSSASAGSDTDEDPVEPHPPPKLFHALIPPHELCCCSPSRRPPPRRRHRPSLDFEKMQQVVIHK